MGVFCELLSPRNVWSYTYKMAPTWVPELELIKDISGQTIMDGKSSLGLIYMLRPRSKQGILRLGDTVFHSRKYPNYSPNTKGPSLKAHTYKLCMQIEQALFVYLGIWTHTYTMYETIMKKVALIWNTKRVCGSFWGSKWKKEKKLVL